MINDEIDVFIDARIDTLEKEMKEKEDMIRKINQWIIEQEDKDKEINEAVND